MIITDRCSERLAQLINGGGELNIKYFAVGNGGTSEGSEITPSPGMTSLAGEVYRRQVLRIYDDLKQPNIKLFDCEVPGDAGPFWITEIGLFDDGAENNNVPELMAIGGYPRTQKMDPVLVGVENDYLITCAVQLTPAQDAVVSIVLDPYFHELSNHQHTGSDGTLQVDYSNITGTEEIENSIRYLHLMDICKRADIRYAHVSAGVNWTEIAKIRLIKAEIPFAKNNSTVAGLFLISATAYYCSGIDLEFKLGELAMGGVTENHSWTWTSPPDENNQVFAARHVNIQYKGVFHYDTDAKLIGKTDHSSGVFERASLIFIPGGWGKGL